ncbi:MAG: beta-ketoacyl-ACP synthase III [Pseudomonadota bacterium]
MAYAYQSVIAGTGSYLPSRCVPNAYFEDIVDTTDEWIASRTGIKQRHFADDDQGTSDLAVEAARRALDKAGLQPKDIGLIIVATVTPDRTFPATAAFVQGKLGCPPGVAFDVSAACAGFAYALNVAHRFVAAGDVRHALVIGADKLSCFLDFTDRNTCVLFGDGAGALVLTSAPAVGGEPTQGVLSGFLSADGSKTGLLQSDGGPSTTGTVGLVRMNGREVFRNAVEEISNAVVEAADRGGVNPQDIDWFVPHQANIRIIEGCAKRLAIDPARVIMTIDRHGNTSSASVPLALDEAIGDGRIKRGDLVAFAALGGGLAWGSALVRY